METALILSSELAPIQARITDFQIDDETIGEAAEFRAELKAFKRRVEVAESEIVGPLKIAYENAREPYLALRKKIDETEKLLNSRIQSWQIEENKRRWEREQKEREAQQRALEAAQKEAEKNADAETALALAEAKMHIATKPQEDKLRSIDTGKAKLVFRDNWIYEVVDDSQVPHEFLMIDDKAVKEAIRRGAREIAGLKIYNAPIPVQGRT